MTIHNVTLTDPFESTGTTRLICLFLLYIKDICVLVQKDIREKSQK